MMFLGTRLFIITLLTGNMISSFALAEPASRLLVFKLKNTGGQALKKVTVNVRLTSSEPPVHSISATATTDGNGVLLLELIPSGTYRGEIAANGFEDYFMDNLTVKPEGITTIEMTLEAAQQVPFVRLENEKITEFFRRCNEGPSEKRLPIIYKVFVEAESWSTLWKEYGLTAPEMDFNKHRVAAVIIEGTGVGTTKIRRITYNPSNKRTLVRLKKNGNGGPRLQAWACSADFVMFPHAPGKVIFR